MATQKKTPKLDKKQPSTGEKLRIKVPFTHEEYKDKSQELTRAMELIEEKETQLKAESAQAKADIKKLKSEVTDRANALRNGYQEKEVDSLVTFDRKQGIKRYFLHAPGTPEHGNFLKQDSMTENDYQLLPMDVPPDKQKPSERIDGADKKPPGDEPKEKPLQDGDGEVKE